MGMEECTSDLLTESEVLEIIRLVFGFAVADNETLGRDPGFGLERASGYSLVGVGRNGMTDIGIGNEGVTFDPKYYNTPPDHTGRSQRYYLHYLVDNLKPFGGQMTRVWCAQVDSEEEIVELVHSDNQVKLGGVLSCKEIENFVGFYVFKHQNIDTSSIISTKIVVSRILEAGEEKKGAK